LSIGSKPPIAVSSKNISKEDFDINNILDEPDSPVVSRRNMKPPLSRKN
jgi:hypothetical protein